MQYDHPQRFLLQAMAKYGRTPRALIPQWWRAQHPLYGFSRATPPAIAGGHIERLISLDRHAASGDAPSHAAAADLADLSLWHTLFPADFSTDGPATRLLETARLEHWDPQRVPAASIALPWRNMHRNQIVPALDTLQCYRLVTRPAEAKVFWARGRSGGEHAPCPICGCQPVTEKVGAYRRARCPTDHFNPVLGHKMTTNRDALHVWDDTFWPAAKKIAADVKSPATATLSPSEKSDSELCPERP